MEKLSFSVCKMDMSLSIVVWNYDIVTIYSQSNKVEISMLQQQQQQRVSSLTMPLMKCIHFNIPMLLFTMTTAVAVASPKSVRKYKASSEFKIS